MRIEISIDDHLFANARRFAGFADKPAVVRIALKAFVEREAGRRLAKMGGSDPNAEAPPRRRF
ncbi:type II toxin-antitoxin system VapB family antitoxin [Bradyrhizobium australiense]|uniref:Type II toxin-antitoxin system VapB family antitoxin n=1 Tax=Bradyrhizobium australiense TaxID=2721161 RepID=A0A7Y4GTJ2_9BRAD|nr:type II toxin-antitoxin system VapB family antitoxin [Bradyrhizobium australiense]NOJ41616.1 type II toxin-antitoxin system VapB family antitoxin [Bradyrhizobium australiense]